MVDRFTSIIDVFDDDTVGLSLDQIATRADLPRSTTHRILDHLVRLRWLCHSERGYGLGARAMSWGAGDAADLRLREAAAPELHRLQTATAAVVHLGVLVGSGAEGLDVVHLDKLGGPSSEHVPTHVGMRGPARRLALGLAVLAAVVPEDDDSALAVELDRVRRTGAVTRVGDYRPGLTSVAATVNRRASVGIVVPDNVSVDRYRPLVRNTAAAIRRNLG